MWFAFYAILPLLPPCTKSWAKVTQPLNREEIGSKREDNEVCCYNRRPVNCTEVGADIKQHYIGIPYLRQRGE